MYEMGEALWAGPFQVEPPDQAHATTLRIRGNRPDDEFLEAKVLRSDRRSPFLFVSEPRT